MSKVARLRYLCFAAGIAFALSIGPQAAQGQYPPQKEVHGSLDAFAAPGVALAWAILRGKEESSTEVVVRVDTDPSRYRTLNVVGIDPFSKVSQPLAAVASVDGTMVVRLLRSRFAELPRTEWRLYASARPGAAEVPALVVFYQGIPDTTPEFKDESELTSALARSIERAQRELKAK
jgi:hypothetical protein